MKITVTMAILTFTLIESCEAQLKNANSINCSEEDGKEVDFNRYVEASEDVQVCIKCFCVKHVLECDYLSTTCREEPPTLARQATKRQALSTTTTTTTPSPPRFQTTYRPRHTTTWRWPIGPDEDYEPTEPEEDVEVLIERDIKKREEKERKAEEERKMAERRATLFLSTPLLSTTPIPSTTPAQTASKQLNSLNTSATSQDKLGTYLERLVGEPPLDPAATTRGSNLVSALDVMDRVLFLIVLILVCVYLLKSYQKMNCVRQMMQQRTLHSDWIFKV